MGTKLINVYDRNGVQVNFFITITNGLLTISRDKSLTNEGKTVGSKQSVLDSQLITDITQFLFLAQKKESPDGTISYTNILNLNALNNPTTSVLLIPDAQDGVIELMFGDGHAKIATITVADENITVTQYEIQKIDPTMLKMALSGLFPKQVTTPSQVLEDKPLTTPLTDLHTHYAGMPTANILMAGIREKLNRGEPVNYPMKYLLVAGITFEDLRIYFNEEDFKKFKTEYESKKNETDPKKWMTFDITKMFSSPFQNMELNLNNLINLKSIFSIPARKAVIFDTMEQYYEYRDVLVKDINLFAFFLRQVAEDYKNQGLQYFEISFTKVNDPEWVKIINEVLPQIENEVDIKIRFLGIIARTADQDTRKEQIRALKETIVACPYIIGLDVLAAETNSTYDMMPELKEFLLWIRVNFPGAVLRVHAGETSFHPENIAGAVELALFAPWAKIRVGHGVHGVHDHVAQSMKQIASGNNNLIIECIPCSNVTLNMHFNISTHTLLTYINNNIPVVLGSDGYGLYQSTALDLIKPLFTMEHVNINDFLQRLNEIERAHIEYVAEVLITRTLLCIQDFLKRLTPDEVKIVAKDIQDIVDVDFLLQFRDWNINQIEGYIRSLNVSGDNTQQMHNIPGIIFRSLLNSELYQREWNLWKNECRINKANFEKEMLARKQMRNEIEVKFRQDLQSFCVDHRIILTNDYIHSPLDDQKTTIINKIPLMINGIVSPDHPDYDRLMIETAAMIMTLLETLEPSKYCFVSTGTDIGIQNIMHSIVAGYNNKFPDRKFDIVGYLHKKTRMTDLSNKLNVIVMVDDCASIYHMYAYIAKQVESAGLKFVAIGGDMWTKDVIQITKNSIEICQMNQSGKNANTGDQLFLLSTAGGASFIKSYDYVGAYSYDNFIAVIMHVTNISYGNANQLFQRHINRGITNIHQGRVTSSDPEELLGKIMASLLLEEYLNRHSENPNLKPAIEKYFMSRINRLPMTEAISFAASNDNDPEAIRLIHNIASSFKLPDELWNQEIRDTKKRKTMINESAGDTKQTQKSLPQTTLAELEIRIQEAQSKVSPELHLLQAIKKFSVGEMTYEALKTLLTVDHGYSKKQSSGKMFRHETSTAIFLKQVRHDLGISRRQTQHQNNENASSKKR